MFSFKIWPQNQKNAVWGKKRKSCLPVAIWEAKKKCMHPPCMFSFEILPYNQKRCHLDKNRKSLEKEI